MLRVITLLFPLWAILLSALAWWQPQLFDGFGGAIVPVLSLIMFLMGLTLVPEDFARVARSPGPIALGVCLQFLVMPLAAFIVAALLALPAELAAGLIVVGCCAGGTASNVICYLAKANVALSITMTMTSTLIGVIATPFLCWLYLSQGIEVDQLAMLWDIVKMVLVPVLAGVGLNTLFHAQVRRLEPVLPAMAIAAIVFIIAVIVALNHERLGTIGPLVLLAVVLHNSIGLVCGYQLSRLLGFNVADSRTIAIEVGMQNSGLGVALALKYVSATAALPGAVFSVWHNLSGSALAAWWGRKPSSAVVGEGQ